jgi:hypothetical protein
MAGKPNNAPRSKKRYRPPRLTVFGSLAALTRGNLNSHGSNDHAKGHTKTG